MPTAIVSPIGGARRNHGIVLIVADDGPGIPADQRAFVLRRFARLSLVNAVAGLHGASLGLADNRPGLACILVFRAP